MNIYIDESGSFVNATSVGSWNVVAALAICEPARRKIEHALSELKSTSNLPKREIKLKQISESNYLRFLQNLDHPGVALFATATDAAFNDYDTVFEHRSCHVESLRSQIPLMKFEGGREGLRMLTKKLEALSPQLYVQLICQVNLIHDVVDRAITYFVQRYPRTLSEVRWRIDQKNAFKPDYEDAFEKIAPALLQARSMNEPSFQVVGFDYSRFKQYKSSDLELHRYLETKFGIEIEDGIDLGTLLRGNFRFEDSNRSIGIQVADLVASGLRRCLRGNFRDPGKVAAALGRLMVQNAHNESPIDLVSFSGSHELSASVITFVRAMTQNSRPMLTKAALASPRH